MAKVHPATMPGMSEIVNYDTPGIPIYIRDTQLYLGKGLQILPHWHEDLELIYVKEGYTRFQINGHSIILQAGESLLVNARQMHYNECICADTVKYLCLLIHPKLLAANSAIYQRYVRPILRDAAVEYLLWKTGQQDTETVAKLLQDMTACGKYTGKEDPVQLMSLFFRLWSLTRQKAETLVHAAAVPTDYRIQQAMVSYIYQNYRSKLTLDGIAAAGSVCRSRCCQLFQKYLHQSPIQFINEYRLKVSCQQLRDTSHSVTQIAMDCGFVHASYYTKLFHRKYHCTPLEYRKAQWAN